MVSLVLDVVYVSASHRSMYCVCCVWVFCFVMDGMNSGCLCSRSPRAFAEDVWMVSLVLDVVYVGASHTNICMCVYVCCVWVCCVLFKQGGGAKCFTCLSLSLYLSLGLYIDINICKCTHLPETLFHTRFLNTAIQHVKHISGFKTWLITGGKRNTSKPKKQ